MNTTILFIIIVPVFLILLLLVSRSKSDEWDLKQELEKKNEELDKKDIELKTKTEFMQLETVRAELNETRNMLRITNEEVGKAQRLISTISHDIGNSVQTIIATLDNIDLDLKELNLSHKTARMSQDLNVIRSATKHVEGIALSILYKEGESPMQVISDVCQIANSVMMDVKSRAENQKIQITMQTGGGKCPRIFGNKAMLRRVFENLIDNAIKYNDKEKGEITITFSFEPSQLICRIKDNGRGMTKEEQDRIWVQFKRGDNAASDTKGYGIGLSSVKKIVEEHQGTIDVHSEKGINTIFTVALPIYQPS